MQPRVLFAVFVLFLAASCDASERDREALAEGDRAPSFALPSVSGGNVQLSDFAGEKPALLYFSMGPG